MVLIEHELKNAYIGEYVPDFATRGPCDSGFHVPLKDEVTNITNTLKSILGTTSLKAPEFGTYLKMAAGGDISYSTHTVVNQGTVGEYWTSIGGTNTSYYLYFHTSSAYNITTKYKAYGCLIRPFKDTPVVPDNSWTELYTNGIYHNSTLGLISIKNGSDWITIADKNLGATTVYNYGDALSGANCGKYYQWGNNYGFAFTGPTTTSTSQVNASTYGPGNYYSSDTFIYLNEQWDTSQNKNLRGGEDGNVPVV